MATRKQRAANRRNAQLSTGPRTPEGKAAVRLNALKHGLTAENAVISLEDQEAFDELLSSFLDDLQPSGPLETALVHQAVMAQWRLVRCRGIETGFFELGVSNHQDTFEERQISHSQPQKLAFVFRWDPDPFVTLSRYEARIERSFYRALHELQHLQADRKTNSVEQTQPAPQTQPNPLPQTDLPPVEPEVPPAQVFSSGPVQPPLPPAHDSCPPQFPPWSGQTTPCPPGACC